MGFFDFLNPKSSKNLNFTFRSSDHLRYERGRHVSGPHGEANRAVKVEPNINGGEGRTVTMYNLDGPHPVWQNNVQMAPKQMKVIEETDNKIVLRGYGRDSMGASFADYGLTVYYQNGEPKKCVLHMHDRGIDIEYLPEKASSVKATTQTSIGENYFKCNFSEEDLNGFAACISTGVMSDVADWPKSLLYSPNEGSFYVNETYFELLSKNIDATLTYDLPYDLKAILVSFYKKLTQIKNSSKAIDIQPFSDRLLPYGFDFVG